MTDRRREFLSTNCPARALTLIETAASIGSAAALIALVVSSLGEARRQEKSVRCISNMARIADASAIHAAQSPSEYLIPVHRRIGLVPNAVGAYEWGGKSGAGEPQGGANPVSSKWGTQEGRGPGTRALNDILFKGGFFDLENAPGPNQRNWARDTQLELDVFRCPGDYGYTGSHVPAWRDSKLTSYDHFGNSYAAATFWVGVPGANCRLASLSVFSRPVSRVPVPARTLSYTENCGRFAWRQNVTATGCSTLSDLPVDQTIRGWHGTPFVFNAAFVDGHVARTGINGSIRPSPNIGRYPRGGPANYSFWSCVIIRGADWQLDVLPAPTIETHIPCKVGPSVATAPAVSLIHAMP